MSRVHHSAIVVSDPEASIRFWCDGVGMQPLMDSEFEGDWPALFGADTTKLRSIFLGSPEDPSGGVVELVVFNPPGPAAVPTPRETMQPPAGGFFLLSVYGDVPAMLGRLADLGVKPESAIEVAAPSGPVAMATVRDPNGVLVELVQTPPHPA